MFHLEQRLREADRMAQAAERDPIACAMSPFSAMCARFLHKARLHTVAVLAANETENLHSLAVQMRPALECAGQVVMMVGTPLMDPERGSAKSIEFFAMAICGTLMRANRGKTSHDELLEMIERSVSEAAASVGAAKRKWPPLGRVRTIGQAEKVSELVGGKAWYDYLSHRFCHGRDLRAGFPGLGGVNPAPRSSADLAFAGFMDYLLRQMTAMNGLAAFCAAGGDLNHRWIKATTDHLTGVRKTSRDLLDAAMASFQDRPGDEGSS